MARPRPLGGPSAGPSAYKLNDPRSDKPSWFSLGGYFEKKGRGKRGGCSNGCTCYYIDFP